MNYLNRMTVKLIEDEFGLETEERIDMLKHMDASTDKLEKTKNPILKVLNVILMHPIGVLLALFGYTRIRRAISDTNNLGLQRDMQQDFEMQIEQRMQENILKRMSNEE